MREEREREFSEMRRAHVGWGTSPGTPTVGNRTLSKDKDSKLHGAKKHKTPSARDTRESTVRCALPRDQETTGKAEKMDKSHGKFEGNKASQSQWENPLHVLKGKCMATEK